MTGSLSADASRQFAEAALSRAQGDHIASTVVGDVVGVCHPGEVILEVAQCAQPGFESACVATNRRLFLGTGPGQLDVVDLDLVTSVRVLNDEDLPGSHSLEVRAMAAPLVWNGFGPRGVARIVHAVEWVIDVHRRFRSGDQSMPTAQLYTFWRDTHRSAQASGLSGDAYDHYVTETMSKVWRR